MKISQVTPFLNEVVTVYWRDGDAPDTGKLIENDPTKYHTMPSMFLLVDPNIPEKAYGTAACGSIGFNASHAKKIVKLDGFVKYEAKGDFKWKD